MPRSSGGIGLKMVEALVNLGLRVTLLVLGAKVMTPLDAEMIAVLHQELR
ncbi:NAD-binding protein [Citrobacter freundii]|nr:NAD-binding protein [Citrobacter freundii]